MLRAAPTHPIHYLAEDSELEERVSGDFRAAFREDLVVHHGAGNEIPLLVGSAPQVEFTPGRRWVSNNYWEKIEMLTPLQTEGDGMRSFVGVLLHATLVDYSVVLVDEPEAFLHPPQARLLGRMLAQKKKKDSQLLIATHSADVVRGLLDAGSDNVRVVRLRRRGNVNEVCELDTVGVKTLWADPVLRYSNVLDGLFHENVVVCEGDADCRFYEAVAVAVAEKDGLAVPDAMFVHCGGKERMATVVSALRAVGVPVAAVGDFDVLNTEACLRGVLEALGGEWSAIVGDWQLTKDAVDSKKPELDSEQINQQVRAVLNGVSEQYFPREARDQIQKILRRSTPWSVAKEQGKTFVPPGEPTQACNRLLRYCQLHGLFLVEIGELEGFVRSVGRKGPAWVNKVLATKDLAGDLELEEARKFVKQFLNFSPPAPDRRDPLERKRATPDGNVQPG
jgi:hypothetical protein